MDGFPDISLDTVGFPGVSEDENGSPIFPLDEDGNPDLTLDKKDFPDFPLDRDIKLYHYLVYIEFVGYHIIPVQKFIDHCHSKFGWSDLAGETVMDVGCGEKVSCLAEMIKRYPNVDKILGIDCDPNVEAFFMKNKMIEDSESSPNLKTHFESWDIEKWDDLQEYEGKMDKVISTYVFNQLVEKEDAFRNVYHLLKPGGEAAVLLVLWCSVHLWLKTMLVYSKWKVANKPNKDKFLCNLYKCGLRVDDYLKIVQKIGFQVVDCIQVKRTVPLITEGVCKEWLYCKFGHNFDVPSECVEEFKKDCLNFFMNLNGRTDNGTPIYKATDLYLLLKKPTVGTGSKTG